MPSRYNAHPRAVIFDMDGTLLNSMIYWRGENVEFLRRRGLPVPEEYKDTVYSISSRRFAGLMIEKYALPITREDAIKEYQHVMIGHYMTKVQPKKGALEYLRALRERGVKTCVATASPLRVATQALDRHGMLSYLAFVTDLREVGMDKDDPRFFKIVMERLGARAEETAMFEDSLYAMRGAKAAGLTVFGIEDAVHAGNPEMMREIHDICDVFVKDFDEMHMQLGGSV